ncbi:hypothetical protein SB6411_01161 [Klebsiella spallanzanii]|uniref:Uncharacterized protein n=1 Tax=Klebsiella spallanzanii TaxID=2587528 RepID=A0A564MV40_9ENTR|nr:hypothetical protein SB6419_00568 [Klebsiella spallanzanii]VUS48388.1 hypothetical protein SB6411_01161 [Klebsiella spallanzanii]VUS97567.1 hypothetical protein SB6408_01738 [Klebsiella spallanzanii]
MRIVFIINTYNAVESFFKQKIELLLMLSKLYFVTAAEIIIILNYLMFN